MPKTFALSATVTFGTAQVGTKPPPVAAQTVALPARASVQEEQTVIGGLPD